MFIEDYIGKTTHMRTRGNNPELCPGNFLHEINSSTLDIYACYFPNLPSALRFFSSESQTFKDFKHQEILNMLEASLNVFNIIR